MDNRTLRRLLEQYNEPSMPVVIKLFKMLNEEKKKHKTRAELIKVIESFLPYLNIPTEYSLYILELYLLNYNKDGDHSNLTKENFVDPRKMSGKWTPNTKASSYTIAQMPFRGSNLEGYWTEDRNGEPYYKVVSYGWYPIYIYKDNKWYEAIKSYSSSTSKQMGNANPVEWSSYLNNEVYALTQDEMKMLERGLTHEDIMRSKLKGLKNIEPNLSKRKKTAISYGYGYEQTPPVHAKFKIKSIDVEDDKAIVVVDILDVLSRQGGKGVPMTQNYLKGEVPNLTPKMVEDIVKIKIRDEIKDYIGTRFSRANKEQPSKSQLEFKFNHLKK